MINSLSGMTGRTDNPGIVPAWLQHREAPDAGAFGGSDVSGLGIDADAGESLPLDPRRPSGLPIVDQSLPQIHREVVEGSKQVEKIRDFFSSIGVKDSEGNAEGIPVYYDPRFPNAGYLLEKDAFLIGNDGESGKAFTGVKDVMAHEYAHRIVSKIVKVDTMGEPGAVNESLADTFAAIYDKKDWTIGEDSGRVVRDMLHPERLGQPAKMSELKTNFFNQKMYDQAAQEDPQMAEVYRVLTKNGFSEQTFNRLQQRDPEIAAMYAQFNDQGGVHLNANIPNKAAALMGEAIGRDKLAKVYLGALRDGYDMKTGIEGLAQATIASAEVQFGASSPETSAAKDAWLAVGALKH